MAGRPPPPYSRPSPPPYTPSPGGVGQIKRDAEQPKSPSTNFDVYKSGPLPPRVQAELDTELRLVDESNREEMDRWSIFYALIRTMEKLENAYIGGYVDGQVYEKNCKDLLRRFATLRETLPANMQDPAIAIPTFMSRYQVSSVAATKRFSIGVPATVAQGPVDSSQPKAMFAYVAEAVQAYITVMDSLRLNMVAVDQTHPLVADIINALDKIPMIPPDFEPRLKVRRWLERLSSMRASDQLDEEQTRQFLLDLETSHQQFMHWLSV